MPDPRAAQQFATFIIEPALRELDLHSPSAVRLLVGTALHESAGLSLRDQWTGHGDHILGPAIGLFQIERDTHVDVWENVLFADPSTGVSASKSSVRRRLAATVFSFRAKAPKLHMQLLNPFYATAIARLQYWRWPDAMPAYDDLDGLAAYYKKFFNSSRGKSTAEKWLADFYHYGGDKVEVSI